MRRVDHIIGLIALVLYASPIHLWPGMSDQLAWLSLQSCSVLFLVLLFRLTSRVEVGLRSLWAAGVLYSVGEVLTDWWLPAEYIPLLGPAEFVIFTIGFVWLVYRPTMRSMGDALNDENIFLVFYRPRSYFDMVKATVGLPVISLGIYAGGKWLRFRKSEKSLKLLSIRPSTERYLLIDTGVKLNQRIKLQMTDLEGSPARHWSSLYLRCRCVVSLVPILQTLGAKWEPKGLDFIPGVYAYRRLNDDRK